MVGIAEVHAHFHAVVRMSVTLPVRDFDGIEHVLIGSGFSIDLQHLEMNLVDVKRMSFKRAVLDRPIFDRADFRRDRRLFVRIKDFLLLSVDGDVELDRPVGAAEFLGEIELCAER